MGLFDLLEAGVDWLLAQPPEVLLIILFLLGLGWLVALSCYVRLWMLESTFRVIGIGRREK